MIRPRPSLATHRELAERTVALLHRELAEPHTLADLARRLATSPFHLCRVFHQQTGTTLHRYRTELRLRTALERLPAVGRDLTELALDLGFSSHSHFTTAFRRAFGLPPSVVRDRLAGRVPALCPCPDR